jgi:hypothetical protein
MALRTKLVTIDTPAQPAVPETVVDGKKVPAKPAKDAGRDHGKSYLITEMDAFRAEWWAIKLALALGKAGMELPENVQGMAAIAVAGMGALMKIDPADAKPLLDEMLGCCAYQHAPGHPTLPLTGSGVVEEASTLLTLRKEVFKLHTGFL